MANTSKFIQLSNQILMEYIYGDSTIGSPDFIETNNTGSFGARIQLLDNGYTNQKYLFTEENPITETGNYRRRSVVQLDSNKFAYLTTSIPLQYIDYDEKLTNNEGLNAQLEPITLYPNYTDINNQYQTGGGILYDNIKLHLISGFNISADYDGFIFMVKFRDSHNNENVLSSITYLNHDNYDMSNPSPFILGEKLYSNYINLKIPSLNWIIDDYLSNQSDNKRLGYVMTGGKGFAQPSSPGPQVNGTIIIELKFISKTEVINNFTYFYTSNDVRVTLNKTDEYNLLTAYIGESKEGDYFEVYGKYNGDIYEDFISAQNTKPYTDLVVIHDLSVYEQINTSFIKTSEQSFVQSGDFGIPYLFRPVIKNSHVAVSYRIDYIMRIYNKIDNSQIIKRAQFSSFNTKKYGKKLTRINLGTVPTVPKIYNTIYDDSDVGVNYKNQSNTLLTIPNIKNNIVIGTEYILAFRERLNISAAISNVQFNANTLNSVKPISSADTIYGLGEGIITISPFDNYILFIFYDDGSNDTPTLLNLTNSGIIYLNFSGSNGELKFKNITNVNNINASNGEILFKIPATDAKKIINFKDKSFYITSKASNKISNSDETMLYHGKWALPNEKQEIIYKNIIKQQNEQIKLDKKAYEKDVKILKSNIAEKNKQIKEIEANVNTLLTEVNLLKHPNKKAQNLQQVVKSPIIDQNIGFLNKSDQLSEAFLENLQGINLSSFRIDGDN